MNALLDKQLEINLSEDGIGVEKTSKKTISPEVQHCLKELFERFWILKIDDEELYYKIHDNEVELKNFLRDTFRYRLILTYDMAKLEKTPVQTFKWMGDKRPKGNPVFKKQRDFTFLFCFLAFLEGKSNEQQFSLQDICESIQAYYPSDETIIWKEGSGYQNRLSLIRILKYAVSMRLVFIVDQHIEDFAGDGSHDVLFEKTPYVPYFMRHFKTDITMWDSLKDFEDYLEYENNQEIERKHRYYRRLFLQPVVYHNEIPEDEKEYIKKFYNAIENNINRFTDYDYERYKNNSMMIKSSYSPGDIYYPSDSMISNLVLLTANYIFERPLKYRRNLHNQVQMSYGELDKIMTELKQTHAPQWTKTFNSTSTAELNRMVVEYLVDWNFAQIQDAHTFTIKEGAFRMVGDYFNTYPTKEETR